MQEFGVATDRHLLASVITAVIILISSRLFRPKKANPSHIAPCVLLTIETVLLPREQVAHRVSLARIHRQRVPRIAPLHQVLCPLRVRQRTEILV